MLPKDSQQNMLLQLFSFFCCCYAITNPEMPVATRQRQCGFSALVHKGLNRDSGDLGSVFRSERLLSTSPPQPGYGKCADDGSPLLVLPTCRLSPNEDAKDWVRALATHFLLNLPAFEGKGAKFIKWNNNPESKG